MNIAGNFGSPVFLSAGSNVVAKIPAAIIGFLCATSTSGTISLFDNTTAASGTNPVQSHPVTAGQFVPLAMTFANGCFATLTNCTGTFTVCPQG